MQFAQQKGILMASYLLSTPHHVMNKHVCCIKARKDEGWINMSLLLLFAEPISCSQWLNCGLQCNNSADVSKKQDLELSTGGE
mmetsp:Transcript_27848/g.43216  ORF Transcript_27848/g.43216 Transcript_27848/m.43216 type:complete len:83 (-) Transcript_27848:338-586(-)